MTVAKCQDCGTVLIGRWCHACGQDARVPMRALGDFVAEYADAAFNVDGRLLRTLGTLVTRPGTLTVEYWAGHRTRWTTPLRLYLIVTFVAFLIFALAARPLEQAELTLLQMATPVPVAALLERLPLMMFLLMPVFAALLRLCFGTGGRLFLEHMVFALHAHTFVFITQVAGVLLGLALLATDAPVLLQPVVSVLVHGANTVWLVLGVRRVYALPWPETLLRYLLLGLGYLSTLAVCLYALWLTSLRPVSA